MNGKIHTIISVGKIIKIRLVRIMGFFQNSSIHFSPRCCVMLYATEPVFDEGPPCEVYFIIKGHFIILLLRWRIRTCRIWPELDCLLSQISTSFF